MKFKKYNKKGQFLNAFGGLAVGIVALSILLVVGFLVLDQGREQAADLADTLSSVNESFVVTPDSFFALHNLCIEDRFASVSEVYNGTAGNGSPDSVGNDNAIVLLNAGNYTVDNSVLNVSDDALGVGVSALGTSLNVSYNCKVKSNAYNATAELTNATNTIPGWVPLIVIAVIGSVLLGLVALFNRRS